MTIIVVNTTEDELDGSIFDGDVSLRDAIAAAPAGQMITFSVSGTINLTLGQLNISRNLTITGPGARQLTIDAGGNSRIFNIDDGQPATQTVSISGLTLTGGSVSGDGGDGDGGAIYSREHLTVTECTISGSHGDLGGGINSLDSNLSILRTTISGNTAGRGGGIHKYGGNLTVANSTISDNEAAFEGGGIFSVSLLTVRHSTIIDNSAAIQSGGGIYQLLALPAVLDHTIVAGNTGASSNDVKGPIALRFSLLGDNTGAIVTNNGGNLIGTGASPIDAQLFALADNGGPTNTHALQPTSPAIDAGETTATVTTDQRGAPFVRVFDGNAAPGALADMGAFERQSFAPSTLVVDTLADENDGVYSTGDLSLREAIFLANSASIGADTITFAPALSGQTIELDGGELQITEVLTIDATALAQNVTVDANQQSRIFYVLANTGNFTFSGLTLTGGRVADAVGGGAIRSVTNGTLTFSRTNVTQNTSLGFFAPGGGIRAAGALHFTQSTISGNSTTGDNSSGGGIYAVAGVTLIQSTVSGNSTLGSNSRGGGISAANTLAFTVTLNQSTVSGNSTAGERAYGGGINTNGHAVLTNSTVSGNQTTGNGAQGGGISTTTVSLLQSTVSGNGTTGGVAGSGILQRFAHGGGIWAFGITVDQSTVSNNSVSHATSMGGGLFQANSTSNFSFSITNSVVSANTAAGGGADAVKDPDILLAVNYSLIGTGVTPNAGGNNIPTNAPMLGPLAFNGGPTKTHALQAASQAINAGNPGIGFDPAQFDQRGAPYARVVGVRIDIGAYEKQAPSADFDVDGFVTGLDFLLWQIGLGTPVPNAIKLDGDADNDLDVDGLDLNVWESQYSWVGIPVREAASPAIASSGVSNPTSLQQPFSHNDLADLALVVALADRKAKPLNSIELAKNTLPQTFVREDSIGFIDGLVDTRHSAPEASMQETAERFSQELSPWQDALDEAFASVFC